MPHLSLNLPIARELYHPLIVHFPIGLWLVGTLLYLIAIPSRLESLRVPAIVIGLIGSVFGWLALKTGGMAADIVGPTLCNSVLLDHHAEQAETALIFFAASWGLAVAFQIIQRKIFSSKDVPLLLRLIVSFGLLMGSAYLALAGHKGFRLVFEEGAAVKAPIQRCKAP